MRLLVLFASTTLLLSPLPLVAQDSLPSAPAAVREAQGWGELYSVILSDAWAGESNAVSALFSYEDYQSFHGRAAMEHRRVLWALLQHLGDARFAAILAAEYPRTRHAVVLALSRVARPSLLRAGYPLTLALGERAQTPR